MTSLIALLLLAAPVKPGADAPKLTHLGEGRSLVIKAGDPAPFDGQLIEDTGFVRGQRKDRAEERLLKCPECKESTPVLLITVVAIAALAGVFALGVVSGF